MTDLERLLLVFVEEHDRALREVDTDPDTKVGAELTVRNPDRRRTARLARANAIGELRAMTEAAVSNARARAVRQLRTFGDGEARP